MRNLLFSLTVLFFAVCSSSAATADTILVPGDFATLQAALDAAVNGDTILAADGTYTGAGNKNLDFHGKSITLRSENGPTLCIIDCEGDGRAFYFLGDGNQIVDGFTVMNGYGDGGGAIFCDTDSAPIIRNCRFIGNDAFQGGGIYLNGSNAIISGCEFDSNSAGLHGGGIYAASSAPTIENSILSGNGALVGGGAILLFSSSSQIINCILDENLAEDYGGGISATNSDVTLLNCTISGNTTFGDGGGVDSYDSSLGITNCIVWGNSGWRGDQFAFATNSSASTAFSDVEGGTAAAFVEAGSTLNWGAGNLDVDPLFANGPLGPYYLSETAAGQSATSPCVDAGGDFAAILGFDASTTRTDHNSDSGEVDMGHHYVLMNQILLFSPINRESGSAPPTFRWTADGEGNRAFSVEIRYARSPWYSTYKTLHLTITESSWTIPQSVWDKIPTGSTVKWRVRGADLDQEPRVVITSDQVHTFYKR